MQRRLVPFNMKRYPLNATLCYQGEVYKSFSGRKRIGKENGE